MDLQSKASLEMNLKYLKLPEFLKYYDSFSENVVEKEFTYQRYLYELSKIEAESRQEKKIKKILSGARFPTLKSIEQFKFEEVKSVRREQVLELCQGHFLGDYTNIILLGTPGAGKSHLASAIGRELCLRGFKVLFFTGCQLLQELLKAKQSLSLQSYFQRLRRYTLVIVDELGYIPMEKSEGELLFQFFSDRYEGGSVLITTNLVFKEWDKIFIDSKTTNVAIDQLIHHSLIFELNEIESYRTKIARKRLHTKKEGNKV